MIIFKPSQQTATPFIMLNFHQNLDEHRLTEQPKYLLSSDSAQECIEYNQTFVGNCLLPRNLRWKIKISIKVDSHFTYIHFMMTFVSKCV